jgi:hypothetical protein
MSHDVVLNELSTGTFVQAHRYNRCRPKKSKDVLTKTDVSKIHIPRRIIHAKSY